MKTSFVEYKNEIYNVDKILRVTNGYSFEQGSPCVTIYYDSNEIELHLKDVMERDALYSKFKAKLDPDNFDKFP